METKGINVKWPHQIDFEQHNRKGVKNLIAPLATKHKVCASTNGGDEDFNEKHQGVPKLKPRPMEPEVENKPRG